MRAVASVVAPGPTIGLGPLSLDAVDDAVHARALAAPSIAAALDPASLDALVREVAPLLGPAQVDAVVARVRARATGLGVIEPLLADESVSEVMVNGPGPVWVERRGRLERSGVVVDRRTIDQLVVRVLAPVGARADRSSPLADARLPDGSRVHVVVPPLAVDGPCITIRRFGARPVPLAAFAGAPVVALLRDAVATHRQILVSGGAGAGKTTLLNALAAHIGSTERVVTVEDAAELRLPGEHVVRLEARPVSAEGTGAVTIRDLVRAALRMRPDRIVVGEVRGAEVPRCGGPGGRAAVQVDGGLGAAVCRAGRPLASPEVPGATPASRQRVVSALTSAGRRRFDTHIPLEMPA